MVFAGDFLDLANQIILATKGDPRRADEAAHVIAARFAAALAAEREECAKVAEEISPLTAGKVIAAAIRARGQE